MKIISRKEAKEQKLIHFFTGIPCKNNHIEKRLTSTGDCTLCKNEREKRRYHKTGGAYHKKMYKEKREEKISKQMKRQKENHEEYLAYQKEWRGKNKDRIAQYRKDNAAKYAHHAAKRKTAKLQATPLWAELDDIEKVYEECNHISSETGTPHHVDHIVPLRNKNVCGLHCLDNLQILEAEENLKKRNRLLSIE